MASFDNRPSASKRSIYRTASEFLLVLLFAIVVLETAFALAGIGDQEYLKPDPEAGFVIMPEHSITFRREGFSRNHFNKFGMADRQRNKAKEPGTFRIAVLGDSIIEALQVERSQSACALLERSLNDHFEGKRKIEVLNFAVSAYNIGQMYVRLKTLVFDFQPDLVVLFVRHHSTYDVIPQANEPFPKGARPCFFVGEGGKLVEDRTAFKQWARSGPGKRVYAFSWLREHSRIWGVIGKALEQASRDWAKMCSSLNGWGAEVSNKQTAFSLSVQSNSDGSPSTQTTASSGKSNLTANNSTVNSEAPFTKVDNAEKCIKCFFPIVDALIGEMSQLCLQHNCSFSVAYMPARDSAAELERKLCRTAAEKRSVAFMDLGAGFEQAKKVSPESIYFVCHLSKRGNAVLAATLKNSLLEKGLLKERPKLY